MNTFRHLTILLLLILSASPAAGQNDYSLRLRSLGVDLAGLVTDPYTDAYLNPARLAVFKTTEIYAAKHPGRMLYADFPVLDRFRYDNTFDESWIIYSSIDPLVFNMILPAGRSLVLSFGAQLDISGGDDIETDPFYEIPSRYSSDLIQWGTSSFERSTDEKHLLFDAAVVRSGPTSLGLRLTAHYDLYNYGSLQVRDINTTDIATQTELETDQYQDIRNPGLESARLELSVGSYNPAHLITDVKLGAGLKRQQITSAIGQLDLQDDDVDGNGLDPFGSSTFYDYKLDRYDSNRDYLGYKVFALAHLSPAENFKSTFLAAYEWSTGDGGADYESIEDNYMSSHDVARRRINFDYDGSTRQLNVRSSIGFNDEIHNGIMAAVGLKGIFSWSRFEEDGRGEASFYHKNSDFPDDSLSVSSEYFQRHDLRKTYYGLIIPVACEWKAHKFLTLRLGSSFGAEWTDDDKEYRRHISDFAFPQGARNPFNDVEQRIWYSTFAEYSNGLEVNINDRFIVEFMQAGSYISLTNYNYLSFRYRF